MGVLSYAALAQRKQERSRSTSLLVAVILGVVCLILFLKWRFAPSPEGAGPLGYLYPFLYLPMVALCFLAAVLLHGKRWRWLPLGFTLAVLLFAVLLTWVDLHFRVDFLVFTIAVFGLGVIYSTGPLGYAALLSGAFGGLLGLLAVTIPHRLAQIDFTVEGVILGLAYAGCQMLETQRRESDEMAVKLEDLNEQLRETSFRDALTGLYNRRFLVEFLAGKRALSARMAIPLSVVLIDLDHFKRINDSLGHAVGDVVLRQVSQLLAQGIRESDLAARYGGEEFVLILPQAAARDAARVTVRILERVRRASFAGVPWPVTFSAGVAQLEEGEPIETLLERADRRLYDAKRKRNLVVSW